MLYKLLQWLIAPAEVTETQYHMQPVSAAKFNSIGIQVACTTAQLRSCGSGLRALQSYSSSQSADQAQLHSTYLPTEIMSPGKSSMLLTLCHFLLRYTYTHTYTYSTYGITSRYTAFLTCQHPLRHALAPRSPSSLNLLYVYTYIPALGRALSSCSGLESGSFVAEQRGQKGSRLFIFSVRVYRLQLM